MVKSRWVFILVSIAVLIMVFVGCDKSLEGENIVTFNEENDLENVEILIKEDHGKKEEAETINTDDRGEVSLDLVDGNYTFVANKDGYNEYSRTYEVDSEEKTINFEMTNDLYAVVNDNLLGYSGVSYEGDAESVVLQIDDNITTDIETGLDNTLKDLGFSSAVINRMFQTRALDGTQTAEGERVNASWTFHPDSGLQIVLEAEK